MAKSTQPEPLPTRPPVAQPIPAAVSFETTPTPEVVVVGKTPSAEPPPPDDALDDVIPTPVTEPVGAEVKASRVPYVNHPKTEAGAPAPVLTPGAPSAQVEADGKVVFISKVPGFQVRLGVDAKDLYTFSGNNELRVDPKIAERLKMHHLYEMGHFYLASEVLRSNDTYLIVKRDDPMAAERAAGKILFYFPEKPTLSVMLPGVQHSDGGNRTAYVNFSDHRVAVEPAIAEVLRKHTFFREGRIRELI